MQGVSRSGEAVEVAEWPSGRMAERPQRHQRRATGGLVLMVVGRGPRVTALADGKKWAAFNLPLAAGEHMARRVRGASEQEGSMKTAKQDWLN